MRFLEKLIISEIKSEGIRWERIWTIILWSASSSSVYHKIYLNFEREREKKHGKGKAWPKGKCYLCIYVSWSVIYLNIFVLICELLKMPKHLLLRCRVSCSSAMLIQCREFSIYHNVFFFVLHWPGVKCILAISSHLIKIHLLRKVRRRVKALCLETYLCLLLKKIDILE